MEGQPCLLVWNYSDEEKARLDAFLQEVGAPAAKTIRKDQGHLLVREILHTSKKADQEFGCAEKVMLFYRIPPKGISFLIDQSKVRHLPRPIYAAVTEYSIDWTFSALVEHLIAERDEIQQAVQQSQS